MIRPLGHHRTTLSDTLHTMYGKDGIQISRLCSTTTWMSQNVRKSFTSCYRKFPPETDLFVAIAIQSASSVIICNLVQPFCPLSFFPSEPIHSPSHF